MVGFGRYLEEQALPEWEWFYLDYAALKRCINECRAAQKEASRHPNQGRLLEARKASFQGRLDTEVLKVLKFYRQQSRDLLQEVERASVEVRRLLAQQQQDRLQRSPAKSAVLAEQATALQALIQRTTQLLQGLIIRWIQILKKYAKNVEQTNEPLAGFMALEVQHPDDPGWRVLQGTYLPAAVADDLLAMQKHQELLDAMGHLRQLFDEAQRHRSTLLHRESMRLLSGQGERQFGSIAAHVDEMMAAEEEAAWHAALVHAVPWLERAAGMFEPPPPDRFAVATLAGLVFNNLSTLLFMANYTAVLPPTDALCVHIGVSSSYTGLIMAASDLAAIVASLGISFWTQRSFKEPLLFAAVACLTGNLLFVAAYQRRSLGVLLLARLFNGLGSARVANRRYTADFVSKAQRTMASAAFVGASNLGMALGPLLSLPLAYLPERQVAGLPLNSITAVGWIMALAWLAFFLSAWICFPEPPDRLPIGLARDSLLSSAASSALTVAPAGRRLLRPLLSSSPELIGGHGSDGTPDVERSVATTPEPAGVGSYERPASAPEGQHQLAAERHSHGKPDQAAAAWRATIPATAACTLALFVQKMVQQGSMDSLPLFTEVLYSWRSSQKGLFLGLLCLAMAPVNLAVGAASARLSDRSMVFGSLLFCCASLLVLTLSAASSIAFFGGSVLLFTASVVLEGTATSLMSKVIWRGFATGVLNAGLLSTEAGTLGRFAGNAWLWAVGKATGLGPDKMAPFAQLLFAGQAAVCAALLAHLACFSYRTLTG